jgi:hypothetical protein
LIAQEEQLERARAVGPARPLKLLPSLRTPRALKPFSTIVKALLSNPFAVVKPFAASEISCRLIDSTGRVAVTLIGVEFHPRHHRSQGDTTAGQ